jgi:hypothetical protein
MLAATIILSISLAAVGVLVLAARCFLYSPTWQPSLSARVSELSAECYLPMLRLLDDSDFRFLSAQPGFTPELAARVRAQRYRVFQAYLRDLRHDFEHISATLKLVLAHSPDNRPDLARILLRAQLVFAWGFAIVQLRAYVWRSGYGSVNAGALLQVFDGICFELRSLSSAPVER